MAKEKMKEITMFRLKEGDVFRIERRGHNYELLKKIDSIEYEVMLSRSKVKMIMKTSIKRKGTYIDRPIFIKIED